MKLHPSGIFINSSTLSGTVVRRLSMLFSGRYKHMSSLPITRPAVCLQCQGTRGCWWTCMAAMCGSWQPPSHWACACNIQYHHLVKSAYIERGRGGRDVQSTRRSLLTRERALCVARTLTALSVEWTCMLCPRVLIPPLVG